MPGSVPPASLILLAMVAATVPPLAAQNRTAVDASGREVVRPCQAASSRKDLPPVGTILDSAAAAAEFVVLPPQGPNRWVAVLSYPAGAATPTVAWSEQNLGPAAVLGVIAAAVLPRQEQHPWAVRLQVRSGSSPRITAEPARYCPPFPTSPIGTLVPTRVELRPGDRPPQRQRIRVAVEVEVLENGMVGQVRVIRGTGMRDMDDSILELWRNRTYLPALLEEMPIAARYRSDGSSRSPAP